MKLASNVTIEIDTKKFGPRQINSFKKGVQTGLLKTTSAPILIARHIRITHGQPFIHFCRYGRLIWGNIPRDHDEFYSCMSAALVAAEMIPDETNEWSRNRRTLAINQVRQGLLIRESHGMYDEADMTTRTVMSRLKFEPFDVELPETFVLTVDKGLTHVWGDVCGDS
jgi:hypothetical protein